MPLLATKICATFQPEVSKNKDIILTSIQELQIPGLYFPIFTDSGAGTVELLSSLYAKLTLDVCAGTKVYLKGPGGSHLCPIAIVPFPVYRDHYFSVFISTASPSEHLSRIHCVHLHLHRVLRLLSRACYHDPQNLAGPIAVFELY